MTFSYRPMVDIVLEQYESCCVYLISICVQSVILFPVLSTHTQTQLISKLDWKQTTQECKRMFALDNVTSISKCSLRRTLKQNKHLRAKRKQGQLITSHAAVGLNQFAQYVMPEQHKQRILVLVIT